MAYFYKAYGLNIKSDILLADWLCEISSFDCEPDLVLKIGIISNIIPNYREDKFLDRVVKMDTTILITIPGIARYLLNDSNTIIIEPFSEADSVRMQMYLCCVIIALFLQQRNYLILHGCCIVRKGAAYIFSGNARVGKTTLALAFAGKGFGIASDDICAIKRNNSVIFTVPSFNFVKLLPLTAQKLGINISNLPTYRRTKKYIYKFSCQFDSEILPVNQICILDNWEKDEFKIERLCGAEKIINLKDQLFNYAVLKAKEFAVENFRNAHDVIANVPVSIIRRPRNGFRLNELVEFIQSNVMV